MRCGYARLPAVTGAIRDPLPHATTMRLRSIIRSVAIVCLAGVLVGCAASKPEPGKITHRKWYQSDMDSEDRSFFLGSFFGGG